MSDPMTDSREVDSAEASPRVSYWSIVWSQLGKNKIAVLGLWCIAGLFMIATFAPLISLNRPLILIAEGKTSFPLFADLFNRLFFENIVDVFFNLLMVLSPLYLALYWAQRRLLRWSRIRASLYLVLLHFILFSAVAPKTFFNQRNPLYYTSALIDYEERIAALRAEGEEVVAVFPPRRYNFRQTNPARSVEPPSRDYWLGADKEGRDVFARLLYGTRISLSIGVVAVAIFTVIGVILGALAGYFGGWTDIWISRIIEVMICIPVFFLILTLRALINEPSIFHVMVIIGITSWTGVARLVRAEFLKQKNLEYAQAALALGIPQYRIIFRHLLPNAIAPVLVSATFGVASAILTESALSFLGLGDPSAPSWGEILNTGRSERKLWLILTPGIAIFFVVSVFNLVGEGIRDALDPKLRK